MDASNRLLKLRLNQNRTKGTFTSALSYYFFFKSMYTKPYDLRKRSNCKRKSLLEPEFKKKRLRGSRRRKENKALRKLILFLFSSTSCPWHHLANPFNNVFFSGYSSLAWPLSFFNDKRKHASHKTFRFRLWETSNRVEGSSGLISIVI